MESPAPSNCSTMLNNGSTNETTPNQCYICDKKYNGSTSKIIRDSLRRHISSVHGAYTLVFAKLAHSSAAPQPLPDKPNRPNLTCCNYCFVCGKKYNGATPKIVKDSLRRHIASAHASYSLIFAKIVRSATTNSDSPPPANNNNSNNHSEAVVNFCFFCGKKYKGATQKIVKDSLRRHIVNMHR